MDHYIYPKVNQYCYNLKTSVQVIVKNFDKLLIFTPPETIVFDLLNL